ncbi:MAG: hypothetical protein ACK5Y2_09500 [Bdellovibrionales bacterium]
MIKAFSQIWLVLVLSLLLSSLSLAQASSRNDSGRTRVTGIVIFERKNTRACAESYCPPSRPYYQASLIKAKVDGFGDVRKVAILDLTSSFDVKTKPKSLNYGGTRLREGMKISLEADVDLVIYGLTKKTHASLMKGSEIRILK